MKQQLWSMEDAIPWLEKITGHLTQDDLDNIEDVWANRTPRHQPRVNQNEAFKKLVSKCNLIMDTRKDSGDYCFIDRSTGETHDIDVKRAAEILGRGSWGDYLQANKLEAEFTFSPNQPPFTTKPRSETLVYNTYVPPKWRHEEYWFGKAVPKIERMPEIFDRYFTHITGGHTPSKEYLLDWIAHSLRNRNFTILTAIGVQGAGKGILGDGILKNLHGQSNYYYGRDEVFKEKFNAQLLNKTIVNIDEVSLKTKEEHDKLKGIVNDLVEIEAKGKNAKNCQNFASFYITSNYMDAIQIEPGDRRYSIIQLTNTKIIETDLRDHIQYLCSPEAVFELGRYLWYRPVTHDMLQPFRSERYEEVRLGGLKDWELFFVEEFCELHRGRRYLVQFVSEEIKAGTPTTANIGRPSLERLQKKYPEKFKIVRDPSNRAKRLVEITG
jgi:hypothetical protein